MNIFKSKQNKFKGDKKIRLCIKRVYRIKKYQMQCQPMSG